MAPEGADGNNKTAEPKVSYLSLPNKGQLAVLCLARIADPLAATSISAYMFFQLKFFDPNASNSTISTQAGIIVGAKTAAMCCTGMLWGRAADSEWGGRKIVLLIGLLCSGIAAIGYGFSTSFVSAVTWQVFGGIMSSNVAITRCVVAELNPEKRYRTRALLLLPLCANAGMLIGPLVGGLLSRKNDEKPLIPSYPYAAPNIVVAAVYAIAIIGVIFGLEETLESLRHTEGSFMWKKLKALVGRGESNDHAYKAVGSEEPDALHSPIMELSHSNPGSPMTPQAPEQPKKKKGRLPFWRIWTFNVCCTMLAHFIIAGHLGTFANLWPIFLSSPVANPSQQHPPFKFNGGLGMQPSDVGYAMSLLGVIGVILQVMIYPMLNDRFGTVSIWRAALYIFPIVYIAAPFPALVASALDLAGRTLLTWIALCLILFLFVIGRTGVTPATTLLINDCTPHPSVRGTIHTAGTVIANLSRSIFPVIAFTVFGKGLEIGVVGLGFWVVAVLALLACVASQWVREGGNGTEIVLEGDEEEENGNAGPSHTNGQVRNRID